ncbi:MAG: hypothetical protein ACRDZ4_09505 [Egibacteraceae bacterium]
MAAMTLQGRHRGLPVTVLVGRYFRCVTPARSATARGDEPAAAARARRRVSAAADALLWLVDQLPAQESECGMVEQQRLFARARR